MSWKDIVGHFDFGDIYDYAIATAKPGDVLVEIGVMFGRSLAYLAEKAAAAPVDIYGVDPWVVDRARGINAEGWGGWDPEGGPDAIQTKIANAGGPYSYFQQQMRMHAPAALERVRVLRLTSVEAACIFEDRSVHLAFIDGDHSFESVLQDVTAWWPKIKPGGMLAGHDWTNYESVREAVKAHFKHETIELERSSWIVRRIET